MTKLSCLNRLIIKTWTSKFHYNNPQTNVAPRVHDPFSQYEDCWTKLEVEPAMIQVRAIQGGLWQGSQIA